MDNILTSQNLLPCSCGHQPRIFSDVDSGSRMVFCLNCKRTIGNAVSLTKLVEKWNEEIMKVLETKMDTEFCPECGNECNVEDHSFYCDECEYRFHICGDCGEIYGEEDWNVDKNVCCFCGQTFEEAGGITVLIPGTQETFKILEEMFGPINDDGEIVD